MLNNSLIISSYNVAPYQSTDFLNSVPGHQETTNRFEKKLSTCQAALANAEWVVDHLTKKGPLLSDQDTQTLKEQTEQKGLQAKNIKNLNRALKDYTDLWMEEGEVAEKTVASNLCALDPRGSNVYLFQEVFQKDRPIVTGLAANYHFFSKGNRPDTMVALHKKTFDKIEDRSFYIDGSIDVSLVKAEVKGEEKAEKKDEEEGSGTVMAFASLHIPGFKLEEKNADIRNDSAFFGDQICTRIAETLIQQTVDCDIVIVGADMNVICEMDPKRFETLKNHGFKLYRTASPTAKLASSEDANLVHREIDYFWVKKNNPGFECAIDTTHYPQKLSFDTHNPDTRTCSDHIMISLKVKETAPSILSNLSSYIWG